VPCINIKHSSDVTRQLYLRNAHISCVTSPIPDYELRNNYVSFPILFEGGFREILSFRGVCLQESFDLANTAHELITKDLS
jgi:hypothetical protein